MPRDTSWNQTLEAILRHGAYVILSRFAEQEQILDKTRALLTQAVEQTQGIEARRFVEKQGLQSLHEVVPASGIGLLRDYVLPRIRPDLFRLACETGRKFLGIEGQFFVDDYTILRINYPYAVALRADGARENPGTGRVSAYAREQGERAKVVDPVYDPAGYHNHEPPPAWAHGPHQDTWTGHSRCGVNLWWAVDDVAEECSMVFYPDTFGRPLEADPRSLYLKAGQPLPRPLKMSLRRGEMLIFNPEMLHGTHLNTTSSTRLALSTRLNPRRPLFDPGCFYAREFWHSSADIEAGDYERITHFPRASNLDPDAVEPPQACMEAPEVIHVGKNASDWLPICLTQRLRAETKLALRFVNGSDVLLVRGRERVHAVEARCPHLNVSLADGYHDDDSIWCPAHAVCFSLESGCSSSDLLSLPVHEVKEEDGSIWLRLRHR